MNIKIGIIIPYFGKLPKNIISFLLSCKKNTNMHWFIFTNDDKCYTLNTLCSNVSFIKCAFKDIKIRILKASGLHNIKLDNPYKLCDYRPLFGKAFCDYLKGYDYWGYSDLDIVYGNLMKYIKAGIKQGYKKIGNRGHFTLIHNDVKSNNMYKLPIIQNGNKVYLFRDIVSKNEDGYAFDEIRGINVIFNQYHVKTYTNPHLVNEIIYPDLDLNTLNKDKYHTKHSCYVWNNGHAQFYYTYRHHIKVAEYGYFHFQKRRVFKYFLHNMGTSLFSITTYGYKSMNHLSNDSIKHAMVDNKSSFIKRLKYKGHIYFFTDTFAHRMHIGKLRLPIKYILHTIFVKKDFRIFKI